MSLARVQSFSISLDGFGTGEGLTRDEPFGHAGERLHDQDQYAIETTSSPSGVVHVTFSRPGS